MKRVTHGTKYACCLGCRFAVPLLLLMFAAAVPPSDGVYVAAVEVNHVVDSRGQDRFVQLIYRDGDGLIIDWRYFSGQAMIPEHGFAVWEESGHTRVIRCGSVYETWTREDPEREECNWRPVQMRRRLFEE